MPVFSGQGSDLPVLLKVGKMQAWQMGVWGDAHFALCKWRDGTLVSGEGEGCGVQALGIW